jgi:AAA family ATP:ADP antiporter
LPSEPPAAASVSLTDAARKTWLDRLLGLAADVRAGEAATALLLAANVFVLLTAYYIIRPVREALILAAPGGAEIKSYLGAILAASFLVIVPAYGAFASRFSRIRLINGLLLFFAANLVLFFVLGRAGLSLGIPFFLWVGIFNLMSIAQVWSFANDVYTPEEGQRLFAVVGFGASVGALTGSEIAGMLIRPLGVYSMMLVAAGLLLLSLVLTDLVHFREKGRARSSADRGKADEPLARTGGFQLVLKQRYLLYIGLLTLVLNYVNTNGEYVLGKTVSRMAAEAVAAGTAGGLSPAQFIGAFYASFQFWQNLLGAFLQFFVVSRVLKYFGVRAALFVMPVISLCGYTLLVAAPVLAYIRIVKILENATDYSLQNTARRALFLRTSREAKYKALQAVETFFWRTGDMLSGATVFVATLLGLGVGGLAAFNIALVLVWLALAAAIGREHRRLPEAPEEAAR